MQIAEKLEKQEQVDYINQFVLQSISRKILCNNFYNFSHEKVPLLFSCCRYHLYNENSTIILRNIEKENCFYSNLQTCKSVWTCPVCSARISENRKNHLEISQASWMSRSSCHDVSMLTLTIPHYRSESLKSVKNRFQKARRLFRQQKPLSRRPDFFCNDELQEIYNVVGSVTALEVTYTSNGWHVHSHEIMFFASPLSEKKRVLFEIALKKAWRYAVERAGALITDELSFFERSLKLDIISDGEKKNFAKYLGKFGKGWAVSKELTLSNIKKGSRGSRTPWDFLRLVFQGVDVDENKKLFSEYAKNFAGSRQLFFSKYMKSILDYDESEDVGLDSEYPAEFLGKLSSVEWGHVVRSEKRFEILRLAELGGFQAVLDYIEYQGGVDA